MQDKFSDLRNCALFLTKKEKNSLLRTQEYKSVISSVGWVFTTLDSRNVQKLPDSAVCVVAPDIIGTRPRQFVHDLVNSVNNDVSKAYAYSGYRFEGIEGAVRVVQKVKSYNRLPFVPRHRVGDSAQEKIDVITNDTFACTANVLKEALTLSAGSGRYDVNISVAFARLGVEVVCLVPSIDWSDLPRTARPVDALIKMTDDEHSQLFSYKKWHTVHQHKEQFRTKPADPDSVAVIMTTHNRTETAKITIESLIKHLKYPKLHWYIADDRSDPGHVKQLVDKFLELGVKDVHVTETNNEHWGLGASLNNALTAAFQLTDVVLTTEDDWYLHYDLDISEHVDYIKSNSSIAAIRLGAVNTIQDCLDDYTDARYKRISVKKYTRIMAQQHRRNLVMNLQVALRHRRLFDSIGLFLENKSPDVVEYSLNKRYLACATNLDCLWPARYDTTALCSDVNPFLHFGESTVGHKYDTINIHSITDQKPHEPRIVVSLTSLPRRIKNVKEIVLSMHDQTTPPDLTVLYLYRGDFNDFALPSDLLEYAADASNKFEIRWVDEDWSSHTKYIFAFNDFKDDIVINIDDDLLYEEHFIENLVNEYNKDRNKRCVICNFSRSIEKRDGYFAVSGRACNKENIMYRPLTGHGTLYPPHVFDGTEIFDHDKAMRMTYKQDEWWLWYNCYKHGIPTVNTQAYVWNKNTKGQHQVKIFDQTGCLYFTANSDAREKAIGKAIFEDLFSNKPRICVVMTATENLRYQYKYTTEINKAYCEKHGYCFKFDICEHTDEKKHYLKKDLINKYLSDYDWILYMDVDAWFHNFDKNIEDLIYKYAVKETDLIVARHNKAISKASTSDQDLVNAGVFLIKNTQGARKILDDWHFRSDYAKTWLKTRTSLNDQPYLCMSIMFNPDVYKHTCVIDDTEMNYFTNRVPKFSDDTFILHASGINYNKTWRAGTPMALRSTISRNKLGITVQDADFL